MSEIEVGTVVKHKASREDGVVVKIDKTSGTATVSWSSAKTSEVPLAALEPVEPDDDGPLYVVPSL